MQPSTLSGEEARTAALYRERWLAHGHSYRTLDWGSRESQQRRFAVLADIGIADGARVLDVGCGLGHFATWLADRGTRVQYTGLDLTPELVTAAQEQHPAHRFVHGSVLDLSVLPNEDFDIVVASGIFFSYPMGGAPRMRQVIQRMWAWARIGLAFNSLSTWAPQQDDGEFHADPLETLAFCRRLSGRLALRHDYHPRDFTLHMVRGDDA
jgi:SAM-dependent methyltransferase